MDLGSRGGPLCRSRRVDPPVSPGTKKVTSHVKTTMLICSSRLLLGSSKCHQKYKKLRIRDTPNPVCQFQTRSAMNLLQIKTWSLLRINNRNSKDTYVNIYIYIWLPSFELNFVTFISLVPIIRICPPKNGK